MINKYRVHEVAKDFDLPSKNVITLLSEHFDGVKKHMTALEENELNYIFETFTLQNQVDSFDEYFETANEVKPAEKPADKKADEKTDKKADEAAASKSSIKPEAKPEPVKDNKGIKTNAPKTGHDAHADKAPKVANNNNKNDNAKNIRADFDKAMRAKQEANNKKKASDNKPQHFQSRTKGETRTVDTRAGDVVLDKYNERYENIAPVSNNQRTDRETNKQKLKQRSQQYRRKGMRTSRRETEAEKLKRIAAERAKKPQMVITIPEEISVAKLAELLHMTAAEVIKKLFSLGQMAAINDVIDYDTAAIVTEELGAKPQKEVVVTIEERIIDDSEDNEENLIKRDPVVVVMGHVDHGKTSLLDAIRNTSVTETEAGGITQAIGACRVNHNGENITFLDTPGHAAFTAMRARGAMATDIAVLVVAADDGIMPQTVEAINHAKAAGVNIIVAINKMDKEGAAPEKILQQLTEYELLSEEWGGDTICVPVSAKTHMGIDKLLESILLVAEMKELKANPNRAAKGVVIEARLDKGRGPIATLLVQNGTLNAGDIVVAGTSVGRVRVMVDDKRNSVEKAGPSIPVEITGLDEVPQAGDMFNSVSDEKLARELVEQRKNEAKEEQFKAVQKVTLDNLFDSLKDGERKDLNIIVKADVQGSAEAVKQNLEKLSNDEVKVNVIHNGVGAINESDIMLANASDAIIIGFSVRPDPVAAQLAERDNVEMRMYRVIYDCIEEIEAAIKGMLAPKFRDVEQGRLEVRSVISISSVGKVAGCYVLDGKVSRNSKIRIVRDGIVVAEDEIASLRRFKDDVKEVQQSFECGITLNKFADVKEGDIFEAFITESYTE